MLTYRVGSDREDVENEEPKLRIELRTSSLQDWCSTSKLFGLGLDMSPDDQLLRYILMQNFCKISELCYHLSSNRGG